MIYVMAVVLWAVITAIVGLIGVVLWKLPDRTRPTLFFAVTVPAAFRATPEAAGITAGYRRRVSVHTIIAAVLCVLSAGATLAIGERPLMVIGVLALVLLPLLWQTVGALQALLRARRETSPHAVRPSRVREAALRPRGTQRSDILLTTLGVLGPVVLLAGSAMYLWIRWEDIPPKFPVHWGPSGQPDRWNTRTPMGVFEPLFIATAIYIPYLLLVWAVGRARRVAATGAAGTRETRFRRWMQAALMAAGNVTVALVVLLGIWLPFRNSDALPAGAMALILAVVVAMTAVILWLCLRAGQGGHRLPVRQDQQPTPETESAAQSVGDGTLDEHWIGGVLYYNRDDAAVVVEKRFGIGWTFNMARPATYVMLAALLVPEVLIVSAILWYQSRASAESGRSAPSTQQAASVPRPEFITDPQLIGSWQSVDFVQQIADFDPARPSTHGELFFKGMTINKDGTITPQGWLWTKGQISDGPNDPRPARYEIRRLDGRPYLFFEWISGDVTIRGMTPSYYVLSPSESRPQRGTNGTAASEEPAHGEGGAH
ncbi:MAG: hypothetical protein AMXMBFR13_30170 [Phycisphaerae bacterium]